MWQTVYSAGRPSATDTTSSKVYNYANRNIVETEDGFQFEQIAIPKAEWGTFLQTMQNAADIDYIAMETGVEL